MSPSRHRTAFARLVAGALLIAGLPIVGLPISVAPAAAGSAPVAGSAPAAEVVRTSHGLLRGVLDDRGRRFLGVPFAAPPVGDLRFRPPQPATAWPGVREATASAPACPQPASGLGGPPAISEDCLYLDVYTPPAAAAGTSRGRGLPVMVWIHGGGLTAGWVSGYDPKPLVDAGVIVVEVAYRLGALGFLGLPEQGAEPGSRGSVGNAGLLDQQAGLRWVKRNIAAFGGDPRNVTVFGESAGGGSVCYQLVSPTSRHLFERTISQSGACVGRTFPVFDRAKSAASAAGLATRLGCSQPQNRLACLRRQPVSALLADPSATPDLLSGLSFGPTLDGVVLTRPTEQALRSGRYHRVPVMLGNTRDEARFMIATTYHLRGRDVDAAEYERVVRQRFAAHADAVLATYPLSAYPTPALALSQVLTDSLLACATPWTLAAADGPGRRLYGYELDDAKPPLSDLDPLMPLGNFHSVDLFYLFAKVQGVATPPLDENQRRLSGQLVAAWTTFARTGRPGDVAGTPWPRWREHHPLLMRLDSRGSRTTTDPPADHRCGFWQPING